MIESLTPLVFSYFENKENYKKVLQKCMYVFRDAEMAKDATQEVFIRIAKSREGNFPKDPTEAFRYITGAIYHLRYENLRKAKRVPTKVEETEAELIQEDPIIRIDAEWIQKWDHLNELILQNNHLFTDDQLRLWDAIYQFTPVEEMVISLDKNKQTIYSLRNKLKEKIKKYFSLKQL